MLVSFTDINRELPCKSNGQSILWIYGDSHLECPPLFDALGLLSRSCVCFFPLKNSYKAYTLAAFHADFTQRNQCVGPTYACKEPTALAVGQTLLALNIP